MIGPNWLDARDEHGNRRLDDPYDFVRIEIAQALQRDIPVIPILLDGARIPKADQLPEDLKELALRNGMEIRCVRRSRSLVHIKLSTAEVVGWTRGLSC